MSVYAHQSTESGDHYQVMSDADMDHPGQDEEETRTKLIVNYLPQSLTDDQFCAIFSTIGPVVSSKIIRDSATNYSYGYGFIEYTCPNDAKEAVEKLKGHPIQNKRLGVAFARTYDKESLKNTNLYVAGIPQSHANEESLRHLFSKFGNIINMKMLTDGRTHQARGTAFIRFDRREEAEEAIQQLNGHILPGSDDPLIVKVSEEHGKQKANHYYHYANKFSGGGGQYDYSGGYDAYQQQQQHYQPRGGYRGGGGRGGYRGGRGGGGYEPRGGRGGHRGGGGDHYHYQRGGGYQGGNDYHYQRGGGGGGGNLWN